MVKKKLKVKKRSARSCVVVSKSGRPIYTDLMTEKEANKMIKKAGYWEQLVKVKIPRNLRYQYKKHGDVLF